MLWSPAVCVGVVTCPGAALRLGAAWGEDSSWATRLGHHNALTLPPAPQSTYIAPGTWNASLDTMAAVLACLDATLRGGGAAGSAGVVTGHSSAAANGSGSSGARTQRWRATARSPSSGGSAGSGGGGGSGMRQASLFEAYKCSPRSKQQGG